MGLRLLGNRIAVRLDNEITTTESGIELLGALNDKVVTGVITHIGPGKYNDKTNILEPVKVQVGDRITLLKANGETVTVDDQELMITTEDETLAIIAD